MCSVLQVGVRATATPICAVRVESRGAQSKKEGRGNGAGEGQTKGRREERRRRCRRTREDVLLLIWMGVRDWQVKSGTVVRNDLAH